MHAVVRVALVAGAAAAIVAIALFRFLGEPRPLPVPVRVDFGPSGSAIVGRVTGARLDLVRADQKAGETPVATVASLDAVLGDWGPTAPPRAAITDQGWLALAVRQRPGGPEATALIDLTRPGSLAAFTEAGRFAFLPDGTLVVVAPDAPHAVLRLAPPYTAAPARTVVPAAVDLIGLSGLAPLSDGSGILGMRDADDPGNSRVPIRVEVAVGWDGSVRAADPTVQPLLATGAERLVGARGETAFGWNEDNPNVERRGGIALQGQTVPRTEAPVDGGGPFAWRPDGRSLVLLETDGGFMPSGTVASFDGATLTRIWEGSVADQVTAVAGFTPDSVLFATDAVRTWRVALDGSSSLSVPGFLVTVVR